MTTGEAQMENPGGHGEKRTRKRDLAIAALMTERTFAAAADKAGVSKSTMARWSKDPEFRAVYLDECRRVKDQCTADLVSASVEAVASLRRNVQCGEPAVEVRAATVLLDRCDQHMASLLIEERLAALEARLGFDVGSRELGPSSDDA